MPQLDPTWYPSQLFWLAVSFALLYALMARVVLPRLMQIMAARDASKSDYLAAAARLHEEAQRTKAEYEHAMADSRERSRAIFTDAELSIQTITETASKQLESTLSQRLQEAEKRISQHKQQLMDNLHEATTTMVGSVVEKFTGAPASEAAATAAVHSARAGNSNKISS